MIRTRLLAAVIAVTLAALASAALAQDAVPAVTYPTLPATGATVEAFVPKGWKVEKKLTQDFNEDGKPDVLLVLHMDSKANRLNNHSEGDFDTNPRMLVALFAQDGGYKLALADHALIPRHAQANMEDPFLDVEAAKRGFVVKLTSFATMGSWSSSNYSHRFRWEGGCFRLIGFDEVSIHRGSGEGTRMSANLLTGQTEESAFSVEEDGDKGPRKRKKLASNPKVCLEQIGNGMEFDPRASKSR